MQVPAVRNRPRERDYTMRSAYIIFFSITSPSVSLAFITLPPPPGQLKGSTFTLPRTTSIIYRKRCCRVSTTTKNFLFSPPEGQNDQDDGMQIGEELRNEFPDDYLITDSLFLSSSDRPNIIEAIANPRDLVAMPLIVIGLIISIFNITGTYNSLYVQLESIAIVFGFISVFAYLAQILSGYNISTNIRRGIIDDATVNLYAAAYTGAVSWLALRTSEACPMWLSSFDTVLPIASVGVFAFSLLAPFLTLVGRSNSSHDSLNATAAVPAYQSMVKFARGGWGDSKEEAFPPQLSPTELLRARGLLAIGVIGCVFAPDALSFALGGQEWWNRVTELHPSQKTLESTTSLCALFAVEASMISHRVGKTGAATYRDIVPAFVVVCSLLAILPCICAIHWLGNDVSYFSFYRE
eukprot:scaffold12161_cov297-Chaetoceros_neogracile.AAC.5